MTLSYDLCKRLKDAGFPQDADGKGTLRKGGSYIFPEGITLATPKKKFDAAIAYAPTLSELIAACGEEFMGLEKDTANGRWFANDYEGATPEEAVALLWLSRNGKRV